MPVTRGFGGRRRDHDPDLPPGQYLTEDFPVLSAGPTPDIDTADWEFTIRTEAGDVHTWNWDELHRPPDRGRHHRHPLRDALVQARHALAGRLARHAVRATSRPRPTS